MTHIQLLLLIDTVTANHLLLSLRRASMKFGKRLRQLVQESEEEWRPNFMDYKILKKSIIDKSDDPNSQSFSQSHSRSAPTNPNHPADTANGCDSSITANPTNTNKNNNTSQTHTSRKRKRVHHVLYSINPDLMLERTGRSDEILLGNFSDSDEEENNKPQNVCKRDDNDDETADAEKVGDNSAKILINREAVQEAEKLHGEFFRLFRRELAKVNDFFLDKQEDFIIDHRQLSIRVDNLRNMSCVSRRDVNVLRSRLTNLHGELVVLEKYSTVNYTGFRKILKKHDKKTGLNIQFSYLNTVLTTPFFLSDIVRKLILTTESQLGKLDEYVKFHRVVAEKYP